MTVSIERYRTAFDPQLPPEDAIATARDLLEHCPVAHSDLGGGFWIVNAYEDCLRVLQDPDTFPVGPSAGRGGIRIPPDPEGMNRPTMPPLDSNLPIHRHFRRILNPYLSPQAISRYEPAIRQIIGGLIRSFVEQGHEDIFEHVNKVFPTSVVFREMMGIDDDEQVTTWVRTIVYDIFGVEPAAIAQVQKDYVEWLEGYIASRRAAPARDDIIGALLTGTVEDGRTLTNEELIGAIQILVIGGFNTTADASSNLVIALIEHPELVDKLRKSPESIDAFIEESLRVEPPVTGRARLVAREVEIGGKTLHAGERVLVNLLAANRDAVEFEHPDDFELERAHNRHLAFAAGIHRCVGSNLARLELRIFVEEVLASMTDIRFPLGKREERFSHSTSGFRAVTALPITYRSLL